MAARAGRLGRAVAMFATLALLIGMGPAENALAEPAPLPPPASVAVSQRATMAIITWPAVAGATSYAVDLDTTTAFTAARRVSTDETVAVLTGLVPNTAYFVRVANWDAATGTTGTWSATSSFTTGERQYALAAPLVELATPSTTSLAAAWSKVEAGLTYQVALGKDPAQLTEVKPVKGLTATFAKLARNTKYYVSVRAVDKAGNAATAWSDPESLTTPETLPLNVGSYNILCANCSKGKASWASRRTALVETIRSQDLDVVGLQEASIGGIGGGLTQYRDLANRLGSPYKLTEYRRGVSPDVRIAYNSERLKLVKQGIVSLPRGLSRRFMDWAVFEQKSTGKQFLFTNTHLEPKDGRKGWSARKKQAKAVVAATARLKGNLPVIAVGDYASTKWEKWGNAPYDVMESAGYLDPLGNAFHSRNSAPGAFVEKRINTSFASLNMYQRKARNFAGDVNGSNTDYIFVSKMRVAEYEVVVKVDSSGRFIGVIPSDHNLIRATVHLP